MVGITMSKMSDVKSKTSNPIVMNFCTKGEEHVILNPRAVVGQSVLSQKEGKVRYFPSALSRTL